MQTSSPPFVTTGAYPTRSGNHIRPWIDGIPAFRRICAAIEAAQQSVWVTITLAQIADYLPQVDGVVITCPLTDETTGLVNAAFFQQLKPGATLVNIARGKIVDQPALIDALNRGVVAQAILDVFDPEPLPSDNPLWGMENVLISPHSSNAGENTPLRGDLLFLENLRRFLTNESLLNEA